MKIHTLRFFAVEHLTGMLLAVIVAHVARVRSKRAPDDATKHRRAARGVGAALVIILLSIPWPFLPYGRPLVRGIETAPPAVPGGDAELARGQELFFKRCAPCHGGQGRGDGPGAQGLTPKPRDFHDPAWQAQTSDEQIETIIVKGGPAVGKSATMPESPDLVDDPAAVSALRAYIRSMK